jgi:hypothetical protein
LCALIRKSDVTRGPALRALNFALTQCPDTCELFIDDGGLKVVFPAFMLQNKAAKKSQQKRDDQNEEHVMSIISQLFFHLRDVRYQRLLNKFSVA